jgi:mRNA interferase HigB
MNLENPCHISKRDIYFNKRDRKVHIITQKRINDAKEKYKESAHALDAWYRIMSKSYFYTFACLRKTFNSVDKVRELFVFNIGGNKLRLITSIHFNRQKVYIRDILNHHEYDENKWK